MSKTKIAISIDTSVLDVLDKKIDGSTIRSRSHAIEHFLAKGLEQKRVDTAIVMLRADQHDLVLTGAKKSSFLARQLAFLTAHGITTVIFVTQPSNRVDDLRAVAHAHGLLTKTYLGKTKNNAQALLLAKSAFTTDCLVVSGDVLNDFDLGAMILKHIRLGKLATMGVMSKPQTDTEGSAIVDGDLVIDFQEKSSKFLTNIVNAGIYVISPDAINLIEGKNNIEYEVFPKLARIKQLACHFIYGGYEHVR